MEIFSLYLSVLVFGEDIFCKIKAQRWGIIQSFLLKKGVTTSYPQLLSAWFFWKKFPFIAFWQLSLLIDIIQISNLQYFIWGTKVTLLALKYCVNNKIYNFD